MGRPLIGITGGRIPAAAMPGVPSGVAHLPVDTAIAAYSEAVATAGGIPLHLPRAAAAEAVIPRLDALVIAGGGDVDPRRYGATPGPHTGDIDPGRDGHELALIRAALDRRLPLLGICRGHQVLNVALGGTLIAHLPPDAGEAHSYMGYPADHPAHRVTLAEGSRLAGLLGRQAWVNSFHHQAVSQLGEGLLAAAEADDGVIEAVELPGADVIGVQWHPEMMAQPSAIFAWLVERATAHAAAEAVRQHAGAV